MKQELQEIIYTDFPELYRGKERPMTESLMSFGLSVGDGWYDLIYQLSEDITAYCTKNNVAIPEVFQVKEKFGGLRYYVDGITSDHYDGIYAIIGKAEADSYNICEKCGEPGSTANTEGNYWIKVLCKDCSIV